MWLLRPFWLISLAVKMESFAKALIRTLQNFKGMTSQAWLHCRNKKRGKVSDTIPQRKLYLFAALKSTRRGRLGKECRPSRCSCSSYGGGRKPLRSLISSKACHHIHGIVLFRKLYAYMTPYSFNEPGVNVNDL